MKNIILILIMLIPSCCISQMQLSLSTGLAGFNMDEMKIHQSELKAQFPVDVKIVKSFPSYWFYELSITGNISDRVRVGGTIGFTSTGGRMDYRDYSGEIACNQLTTAFIIAVRGEVLLNPDKRLPIYITGKSGVIPGRYDLDLSVELNNQKNSDQVKFKSTNFFIEPGIMTNKRIAGPLSAILNAGYNLNVIKGKQKLSDNKDLYLLDNSGNKVRLDWSGFRVSVGLSISF